MTYKVIPVNGPTDEKLFLHLPFKIYGEDKNWIPPLENDINAVFNPEKNPEFKDGDAFRWILLKEGNPVGRIGAFQKEGQVSRDGYQVGGVGFFECINDQEAANLLFDTARDWLKKKGAMAMDGPINFGQRDKFWGLLEDGFSPPSYLENYNPAYYKTLFENYGFVKYFGQHTYILHRGNFDYERMGRLAEMIGKRKPYEADNLNYNNLDKYADDFLTIYNAAWKNFQNFKPMEKEVLLAEFRSMKPAVIEDFMIFIYMNNKPAGFFILLPDINQIFKHLGGKLNLWGKIKFLWYKKTRKIDTLKGLIFGVHPDFHNVGVDALLVDQLVKRVRNYPEIENVILSWIGEFNPKMQGFMKNLKADLYKVHGTYRKTFDKNLVISKYEIVGDN